MWGDVVKDFLIGPLTDPFFWIIMSGLMIWARIVWHFSPDSDRLVTVEEMEADEYDHELYLGTPRDEWEIVSHTPIWTPADLPIDGEGNTRPGFHCTHVLENGNGVCGGNVFDIEDAISDHCCVARKDRVK